MEEIKEKIKKLIELTGLSEIEVNLDEEHRKISLVINDEFVRSQPADILFALDHIINLFLRKEGKPSFIVDLNFYRKERERLIIELARAAAHKAMITKQDVDLPAMNAYERRLVHMEITTHPELKTESVGADRDRHIVIKQIT
ncbi:MAG: R3H domain-containing nucleic acid-binding protein [Patescibacteria group bacterium]|nr:R3H domain-containing nucleic acid-binding protein [Patescibacteria group bacterium]